MSKHNVKIETLTAVHVGEDNHLINNRDFIVEGDSIYVIDPDKLINIIGSDKAIIDKWVAAIDNDDFLSFLNTHTNGAEVENYSSRIIANFAGSIQKKADLATCIHDGRGLPYIPGSSLKGAIRTAVTATILEKDKAREIKFEDAKRKAKNAFGSNPQSDLFRFLTVGDAFFDVGSEVAVKLILLNQRVSKDSLVDKGRAPQIVEAIAAERKSTFSLTIDKEKYDLILRKYNFNDPRSKFRLGAFPSEMNSVQSLFSCINKHTKWIVEDEISYWQEYTDDKYIVDADDFINRLNELRRSITSCVDGTQCVLRLGQGSGWRFITGAWTEIYDNFYGDFVPRIRHKRYAEYDFPKSRRIDQKSNLLGFVKLTLLD